MHGGHGLAAILPLMAMRRARHRFAALHGFIGSGHAGAVEGVRSKRNCDRHQKKCLAQSHRPQLRLRGIASQAGRPHFVDAQSLAPQNAHWSLDFASGFEASVLDHHISHFCIDESDCHHLSFTNIQH
jgi:hypothetical protein